MAAARTTRQRRGDTGEVIAAAHLTARGWTILGRQVRLGRDEIDLVAIDPGPPVTLVVVEVRSHSTSRFGSPEESVDRGKLMRCYRALAMLRRTGSLPDGTRLPTLPWRVDILAVDVDPALAAGVGGPRVRHLRAVTMP